MIATVDASKHIEEFKESSRKRSRNTQLKNTYGISLDDYNALLAHQDGKCAICGKHQTEFDYPLHVDHDHQTGQVRGLLCCGCNTGLGQYEKHKNAMADYLAQGCQTH